MLNNCYISVITSAEEIPRLNIHPYDTKALFVTFIQ